MSLDQNALEQIINQINQITQSLDGTIAQLEAINRGLEENAKNFMESITAVNENMRLIIEVIKRQRINNREALEEVKKHIDEEIQQLWTEKSLEAITKEQMEAVKRLANINAEVSENLYMAQLLAIIQSLREITGRALAIKLQKEKAKK